MKPLDAFIESVIYSLPPHHSRDIVIDFDLKLNGVGLVDIHGNQSIKFSLVVKANKRRWLSRFRKPEHKTAMEVSK
jgi:hypothetical protein